MQARLERLGAAGELGGELVAETCPAERRRIRGRERGAEQLVTCGREPPRLSGEDAIDESESVASRGRAVPLEGDEQLRVEGDGQP